MKRAEILMATYNGAAFLPAQLDSILAQDTDCWHLTVSDDGSTDGTPAILESYASRFPEKIAVVHSGRCFGNARDHFFWLMNQCQADYMHFCDQDDVWHPDKVRLMQEAMERAEAQYGMETPLLVFTDQAVVDEELNQIAPSLMHMQRQNPKDVSYQSLLFRNVVTGCTAAINGALARMAGAPADVSGVMMHDWWLGLTAARFGKLIYLNRATIDYRQHGDNNVGAKAVANPRYIVSKFRNMTQLKKSVQQKKSQALCFAASYEALLNAQELSTLRHFGETHSPWHFKCRYCAHISGMAWQFLFVMLW